MQGKLPRYVFTNETRVSCQPRVKQLETPANIASERHRRRIAMGYLTRYIAKCLMLLIQVTDSLRDISPISLCYIYQEQEWRQHILLFSFLSNILGTWRIPICDIFYITLAIRISVTWFLVYDFFSFCIINWVDENSFYMDSRFVGSKLWY